jgi:hypothetical protein
VRICQEKLKPESCFSLTEAGDIPQICESQRFRFNITFYFHLDDPSVQNARKFLDILDEQGFVQHVVGATHIRGYTLDVFITRDNSSILPDKPSILEPHLCHDDSLTLYGCMFIYDC